ncbi:MAG: D-alanyl-D-alanine carboxypeptidase [Lachnospiraceae bacterium]|nr:D-alanyl-D-alanine carboxypeptidase [Lachnospiraceae bacterium]
MSDNHGSVRRRSGREKRRICRGLLALMLAVIVCISLFPASSASALKASSNVVEGPGVYAEGYVVVDVTGEQIIAERNMEKHFAPASYAKLVTALVVIEHVSDLNERITFSKEALESLTEQDSRLIPPAVEGESITIKDALYGLVMQSSNECANQLALYVSGNMDSFVKLMNHRMEEMGCKNTRFMNVTGLDVNGQYTCAKDMATFYLEAMKNPDFKAMNSAVWYNIPANNTSAARFLNSKHEMMNGLYEYNDVTAGRAGSTADAGKVVLTLCERDNYPILVVLMKSTDAHAYPDTEILLEYAYNLHYGWVKERVYEPVHDTCTVNDYVDVHLYESYDSETLLNLTPGAELERTGTWWLWSRVNVGGKPGYVETALLTSVKTLDPLPDNWSPTSEEPTEATSEVIETESESESETESVTGQEPSSEDQTKEPTKEPSSGEAVSSSDPNGNGTVTPTTAPERQKETNPALRSVFIYGAAILVLLVVEIVMIVIVRRKRRS